MKAAIFGLLAISLSQSFEIVQEVEEQVGVPRTYIGTESIACHPSSAPQRTNGFATHFHDTRYACENWSGKAMSSTDCFVALNGVCGMSIGTFCDKCVEITNANNESERCRVIDFCDPSNCDFLDPGHLDILENAGNAHYRFTDKGKYVVPYKDAGGQPIITWRWTSC